MHTIVATVPAHPASGPAAAWCRRVTLTLLLALATGLGGCAWLDAKQRQLALRPSATPVGAAEAMRWQPRDERLLLRAASAPGEQLALWWLPHADANAPTLLYLHGTLRTLYGNAPKIEALRAAGFSVLAVDYRGWGDSSAIVPSEASIVADAWQAWAELQRRQPQPGRRVLFGHSMGSAVAVTLASQLRHGQDYGALALEAPFNRIADVRCRGRLLGPCGRGADHAGLQLGREDRPRGRAAVDAARRCRCHRAHRAGPAPARRRAGRHALGGIPRRQPQPAAPGRPGALLASLPRSASHACPAHQPHHPVHPAMTAFVDFSQVWLAYNDTLLAQGQFAVEDINLKVNEGEFIAIVGPSGCGKSTFMKLATGLKMPSKGTVIIGGQQVTGPLKITGMAFQAPSLLPWRTTVQNVMLPLEIVEPYRSNFKQRRAEYEAKARTLLQSVGLGGYEDKFPWQLSGGMQQRASICRALVHEPKMLLLDEPFGALDAFTREELWCALRDLQAAQKFNVILVTHDLRESVFLADTVYVMSRSPGRFVVRREIDLPRPRDLEITYTPQFTDIVHELRGHIGAVRNNFGNSSGKAAAEAKA